MERVTITIRPAPGEESLRVEDAMQQVMDTMKILADASNAVESGAEELEWRLERASTDSPLTVTALAVSITPDFDIVPVAQAVKREVARGVRNLMERGEAPPWMGPDTLRAAKSILGRTSNGVGSTAIEFFPQDTVTIDRLIAETSLKRIEAIDLASVSQRRAYGEIEGRLVSVGLYYKKPAIQVINRMYGTVWCRLSDETIEHFGGEHRLKEVWEGKTIGATGKLFYQPDGSLRYVDVDANGLRMIPKAKPVVLDDLVDPDFTAGLDPAEYLRRFHEGWVA